MIVVKGLGLCLFLCCHQPIGHDVFFCSFSHFPAQITGLEGTKIWRRFQIAYFLWKELSLNANG